MNLEALLFFKIMKIFKKIIVLFLFCFNLHSEGYLVMDDEIETFLNEIAYQIKEALGHKQEIKVYISDSTVLNACACQDGNIIINAGAIIYCKDVKELIGILAHEVAHVTGNHISTFMADNPNFMKAGLITMLIGAVGSILAGDSTPLAAGMIGGQQVAQRMGLAKLRQKENMADSKAAIAIEKLQWPVLDGFVSVHEKLGGGCPVYNIYESTHPSSSDRIAKFRNLHEKEKQKNFPEEKINLIKHMQEKFEIIQEKIIALVNAPEYTIQKIKTPTTIGQKYAKAIALYRLNEFEKSIKSLDELMGIENNNPVNYAYYTEIKCMCLIGLKKYKEAADLAYPFLEKTKKTKIYRDLGIIYADAVYEGNLGKKYYEKAISILKNMLFKHRDELSIYNILGKIYSLDGQDAKASLCAAEIATRCGDDKKAKFHARNASKSKDPVTKRNSIDILSASTVKDDASS